MENKKDLEVKQEEVTTNQEPKKILEEEKTVQEPQQPQVQEEYLQGLISGLTDHPE